MGTPVDEVVDTFNELTGNPFGIPGADVNMIENPTDVGDYAPVTQAAAIAGGGLLAAPASPAAVAAGTAGGGTASTLANVATILTPVASLAAAASGMKAANAAANAPSQMILQPVLGGPNTILATRGSVTEQLRRRGRAATIMTEPQSETLGA